MKPEDLSIRNIPDANVCLYSKSKPLSHHSPSNSTPFIKSQTPYFCRNPALSTPALWVPKQDKPLISSLNTLQYQKTNAQIITNRPNQKPYKIKLQTTSKIKEELKSKSPLADTKPPLDIVFVFRSLAEVPPSQQSKRPYPRVSGQQNQDCLVPLMI
ncbi:hypothetical protein JTE90_011824 [Oedothorax gibbosus]|uniref:Uncharacterized protein n=1 Tax=Oedothorax gibbosus TaxID=931172 RepID=A0AAV6VRQ1_9ARAC|nr:hypothetical protein JTE90_011824 [Oedothorax gibbosus]